MSPGVDVSGSLFHHLPMIHTTTPPFWKHVSQSGILGKLDVFELCCSATKNLWSSGFGIRGLRPK